MIRVCVCVCVCVTSIGITNGMRIIETQNKLTNTIISFPKSGFQWLWFWTPVIWKYVCQLDHSRYTTLHGITVLSESLKSRRCTASNVFVCMEMQQLYL